MQAPVYLAVAAFGVGLAWPDQGDQPPVTTHRVEAEYPPEMAKSFVVDNVGVRMVVGADGAPLELNASGALPDNVVRALAQWRFRPGTHSGQPVTYAVVLSVPVHRPITRSVENALRRRWSTWNKEINDAIKGGTALDAAGAEKLAHGLAENSASLPSRITLLAYYASTPAAANADVIRKARADQIAWLVENLPETPILDSPLVLINVMAGPLADELSHQHIRDLWLQRLASSPDKLTVLAHASNFLRVADPEKTEQLLVTAAKSREAAVWLGDVYGLAMLGVTGLDLNTGLPASAAAQLPDSPFPHRARVILRTTDDARVLLSGLATLTAGGRALSKAGRLPEGYAALCQELLARAKQIYPDTSESCDVAAPEPEARPSLRIRVGGNVQQAKLISQRIPKYPPEARQRRIEGALRFQAVIDKQGEISELEFLRGPLIFYDVSRESLLHWKYQPTLLNREPVEVLTEIDVNFTLSR